MADILIYGTLRNNTSSHVIAQTDQIQDKKLNKSQETINQEVNAKLAGGVATLGSDGKVPASMLPSYVDDVLEFGGFVDSINSVGEQPIPPNVQTKDIVFVRNLGSRGANKFYIKVGDNIYIDYKPQGKPNYPEDAVPASGKIYVDLNTNKCYRWSGSDLVEVSQGVMLGETSGTAFRGDFGKAAYNHAQAKGAAFGQGLYKITTNAEGHVTAATAVTKADITALGIPGEQATVDNVRYFGGIVSLINDFTVEPFAGPVSTPISYVKFVTTTVASTTQGSKNGFYYVIDGKYYKTANDLNIKLKDDALYVDINANKVYRANTASNTLVEVGSPTPQTLTDAEIDAICV